MDYIKFQEAVSNPRLSRYLNATEKDANKALLLYKANLRLSQKLFSVLGVFEVTLRNAIDRHYKIRFGKDWLFTQSNYGGFFWRKGCDRSRENLLKTIGRLGNSATNDRVVSEMNFGFWRYLFASKEFAAGGSTLLKIFHSRPSGINHTFIFNAMSEINTIRNRIAHHEPISFAASASSKISTLYVSHIYSVVLSLFIWLNADTNVLLAEIDFVEEELNLINSL